jgi:hypothetical protein
MVTPVDAKPLKYGGDNTKLGGIVKKGPLRGAVLYQLTLEERATCWTRCGQWAHCYGNHMPFAKRHVDGPEFRAALECQLAELCSKRAKVLIRLHVLGDFPSPGYVRWWRALLEAHPNLWVFGYTHYPAYVDTEDPLGIGIAVQEVLNTHPRSAIKQSRDKETCGTA